MTVLRIGAVKKRQKAKENFTNIHGHNTLRLFDVLPNFLFITNETKHRYY